MWFDSAAQIPEIAIRGGTSIFVMPIGARIEVPQAILLEPVEKSFITIEQVRQIGAKLRLKQTEDRFIIVRPADKLTLDAANAFLKNLEEPGDKVHYILITEQPSQLLPTILSRSMIYFLRDKQGFSTEIQAKEEQKQLVKKLIAGKPADLVEIAEKVAKKKPARAAAMDTLGLAIEMLQKSYFITGKEVFVKKIPKFLTAYDNISKNGHVKLQIVANLC
ncbi:hypothetical protein IJH01_01620 [Candidatus Saccharibacteria bacterium]|nr:hypothetical protein [Candidatus Saccharibacteria bacterium]